MSEKKTRTRNIYETFWIRILVQVSLHQVSSAIRYHSWYHSILPRFLTLWVTVVPSQLGKWWDILRGVEQDALHVTLQEMEMCSSKVAFIAVTLCPIYKPPHRSHFCNVCL